LESLSPPMEKWNIGIMEYWNIGIMEYWNNGETKAE
jgi:hypothetical protein